MSERYKDDLEQEIPEVDQFFGTTDLPILLKALGANYKHELIGERLTTTPKHYAYLKISEGCDRPCSFCAIPLMRGKHRSTPIEVLVQEAKKLASDGVKELILIAQDLTYYGLDLYKKRRLAIDAFTLTMVKMLCKEKSILIIDSEKKNTSHRKLYSNSTNIQTYNITDTFTTGDSWKTHFETIKNDVCDIACDIVIVESRGYGMLLSYYLYKKCHKSVIQITGKSTFFD